MGIKITASKGSPAPPAPNAPPTPAAPGPASVPTARVRPLVEPRAPKSAKNSARILMTVLDGKVEWEKMDSTARKSFEELFRDQQFLRQFGVAAAEKVFQPEQMKQLYGGISMMYQQICGMFLRWPAGALKMLAYTEEQKEALAEPTANFANEFAPELMKRHSSMIIFLSVFGAITQSNFLAASMEAKKLKAASAPPKPVVISAPARRDPGPAPANRPAPEITVPFVPPSAPGSFEGASLD